MLINAANIQSIDDMVQTRFHKGLELVEPIWPQIATPVPSSTAQNIYAAIKGFPKLREWIGERQVQNLTAEQYTIVNKDYEATIGLKRTQVEDDNLGLFGNEAEELGRSARQHPDELLATLLAGAFDTYTGIDGQYFFDSDHPTKDGTQSNTSVLVLDISTQAAAIASVGAGIRAMAAFTDYSGRKLNIMPDTIMVPVALMDKAWVLYNSERLEDGKPNPYKGRLKPVVNPYLTSATAWFLLKTNTSMPAFLIQQRKAPEIVSQTEPRDDVVFRLGQFLWGVDYRGNVGFGIWQHAWGSTGTG